MEIVESNSECEEEILVYAEFGESVNIGKYRNIHVLGIDGKTPIVQLDDTFYKGKYENPLGTYLFFEEDSLPYCADAVFDKLSEKNLKYIFKTSKILSMDHAYVAPKEGTESNVQDQLTQPHPGETIDPTTFASLQEALDTFKKDYDENCQSDKKPDSIQ